MDTLEKIFLKALKSLTPKDVEKLLSQLQDIFVDIDVKSTLSAAFPFPVVGLAGEKKTTFDVVLEDIAGDKRVAVLKIIRNLTSFDSKEAKAFIGSLPKAVKEGVSKEEAEAAKQQLEEAGGKVKIN